MQASNDGAITETAPRDDVGDVPSAHTSGDVARLAASLLNGPNAHLFRRFEAEEGKARHLTARTKLLSDAVEAQAREHRVVQQAHSADVTERISQLHALEELERQLVQQDRQLDADMGEALTRIEHLAASASSAKLQLAHNFELHGALRGADETDGVRPGDVTSPFPPEGGRSDDSATERAALLVLAQARDALIHEAMALEVAEQRGLLPIAEAERKRLALAERAEKAQLLLERVLGRTTSPTAAMGCEPAASPATLAQARRDAEDARSQLDAECRVSTPTHFGTERAWLEAMQRHDDEAFAQSRIQVPGATCKVAAAPHRPASSTSGNARATCVREGVASPEFARGASSALARMRCKSARAHRFLRAAARALCPVDHTATELMDAHAIGAPLADDAGGRAALRPRSAANRYKFRSHGRLEDVGQVNINLTAAQRSAHTATAAAAQLSTMGGVLAAIATT